MHKHPISLDFESIKMERDFEQKFGREMTREEKRLFALSAPLFDPAPEVKSRTGVERRSNLRIMPSADRRAA